MIAAFPAAVGWNGNRYTKVGGATVAPPKTTAVIDDRGGGRWHFMIAS